MASSPRLPLLLAVIATLCAAAVGLDAIPVRPLGPSCSTEDNYTDGSQYKKNLDQLLAGLPAAAGSNGWFYNGTAGVPGTADQAFGLIMCYADRNATECQVCRDGAPAEITKVCPGSRTVRAAYDSCVLQYSPPPTFFSRANLQIPFLVRTSAPGVTVDPDKMLNAWLTLMTSLTGQATSSPSRVANSSTLYDDNATMPVYGLVQCRRDLNSTECSRCISFLVGLLRKQFTNDTGGAIKAYSCYVRYELGAFDITLPPESPPASSPLPEGSSSSSGTGLVAGLSVGSVLLLIIFGSFICLSLRRRQRKQAKILEQQLEEGSFFDGDDPAMEDDFEKGTGPKRFRYGELAIATDNFSNENKLGEGGFGSVYRGHLKEMNLDVAIKRVSKE